MSDVVRLITPEEAMPILRVGKNRIYDLVKEKDFPSFRQGARYFIYENKLGEWIEKQCKNK